jgi:hypothetical protein
MSHDDICGMTFTQSLIYIATKCEITIASLTTQSIIAQYGIEGDGPEIFKHQYKIDDTGYLFIYVDMLLLLMFLNNTI